MDNTNKIFYHIDYGDSIQSIGTFLIKVEKGKKNRRIGGIPE